MTTKAADVHMRPGLPVLLLWALLVQTSWAQGDPARTVVLPDDNVAGGEVADGQLDHCHSWPVSRHISIYNELTRGGLNGTDSSATYHEVGRVCDGAVVGPQRGDRDHFGHYLTAWWGTHGAGRVVSTAGTGVRPGGGDTANARESTRQETERNESVPSPEDTSKDENPLVLQFSVSHHRNYDQVSLVFREDVVDLVTNTYTYQQDPVRLGWLRNPMRDYFAILRDTIEIYHAMLGNTVSVLELLLNDPDLAPYAHLLTPEVVPHAPLLTINGDKVEHDHPYFEGLANIFDEVWKEEWNCVDCATYRAVGDHILRIRTGEGRERSEIEIPMKLLDCVPVGHDGSRIECVDDDFGIFQIPAGEES